MRKYQTNKYNSFMGIKAMLEKHQKIYRGNKLAEKLIEEYMARLEEILVVAGKSDHQTKTITQDKLKAKIMMAEKAIAIASAGALYALDGEDAVLLSELNYSYTKIRYAKDADSLRMATGIEETLRKHQDRLGDYMVTEQDLDDFQATIQEFNELYQLRINERNDIKTNKRKLVTLFLEMDRFLDDRLDRLVQRFGMDHKDFADHYFQARRIDDL